LRQTLGVTVYDADTHLAWVKIISRIMRVIIPAAVKYEVSTLTNKLEVISAASVGTRSVHGKKREDRLMDVSSGSTQLTTIMSQ
jgi:hypothetical protein